MVFLCSEVLMIRTVARFHFSIYLTDSGFTLLVAIIGFTFSEGTSKSQWLKPPLISTGKAYFIQLFLLAGHLQKNKNPHYQSIFFHLPLHPILSYYTHSSWTVTRNMLLLHVLEQINFSHWIVQIEIFIS